MLYWAKLLALLALMAEPATEMLRLAVVAVAGITVDEVGESAIRPKLAKRPRARNDGSAYVSTQGCPAGVKRRIATRIERIVGAALGRDRT